jgi:translation initiation factor eIF-2B subunit epsilon
MFHRANEKKCLLPLANIPLIEYTLEFLANAGVEEVFLYCRAHTEHIEEYIGYGIPQSRS